MKKQLFTVLLEEDVIISRHAATLGGQGSLNFLPGATFLGASANKLYQKLNHNNPADAYLVFHSGKVRFGDALLLSSDGRPTYPVPLCLHASKEYCQNIGNDLALDQNLITNNQFPNGQRKPLDNGYVTLNWRFFRPSTELRMKTGINPHKGIVNNGQLFGYAGLPAGLRFSFILSADDDEVSDELFNQIINSLEGKLRIGRSRSAEYGSVRVSASDKELPAKSPYFFDKQTVTLWLLSDMALQDDWGQPTLNPNPEHFALPPGSKFDINRSFIKTRRYTPFNSHYHRREQERVVISMGSVLCFTVPENFDANAFAESLESGVGLYRQAGLGQVWVNPPLLAKDRKPIIDLVLYQVEQHDENETPSPNTSFASWLSTRTSKLKQGRFAEELADTLVEEIQTLYQSARQLASIPADAPIGPSSSQWGRIMSLAKTAGITTEELQNQLFNGDNAICKAEKDPAWKTEVWPQDKPQPCTFREWLENRCESIQPSLVPAVLAQTARQAAEFVRIEEEGNHYAR